MLRTHTSIVTHACDPSSGDEETGESLRLAVLNGALQQSDGKLS